MTDENQLPSVPSELITVALNDFIAAENAPNVKIDMDTWHAVLDLDITKPPTCVVCLGGAVIRGTLMPDIDTKKYIAPEDFDVDTEMKLHALDALRQGRVLQFLDYIPFVKATPLALDLAYEWDQDDCDAGGYCSYEDDDEKFKDWLKRLATAFKEVEA